MNLAETTALGLLLPFAFAISPAKAQIAAPVGTYIRVEAGTAFHQNVTFTDTNPGAANCDLCTAQFPSTIAQSFDVGGALGYRIGPFFRTDLSIDYIASTKISGYSTATIPSTGSADVKSVAGLINGYIDLPAANVFGSIQPYLDAGIGIAWNDLGTTSGTSGAVGPFTLAGSSHTNFAWAIGAGVGYPLTTHMTLDIAYRFLDLGQLRTDTSLSFGGMTIPVTPSKTGDSDAHQVTIGLRYDF